MLSNGCAKSKRFLHHRQKNGRFVNLYKVITNQFATIPNPVKEAESSPYLVGSWLLRVGQEGPRGNSILRVGARPGFFQDTDSSSVDQNNSEDIGNYMEQTAKREAPKVMSRENYSEADFYTVPNPVKKDKTMTTIQYKRKQLPTISSSLYKRKLNLTLKGRCKSTNKRITIRANCPKRLDTSYEIEDERSLPPLILVFLPLIR
eukprot:TRINITY_DN14963_c0_g1_i9.p1 TRINITY_DN14963_c0_g1~~TRINITY_DN14963_c0_g1_i9.p1  ORF type:complete len:204 (+),score=23.33 TRINITY_DN14963_c0_g1_i9:154-765(+)